MHCVKKPLKTGISQGGAKERFCVEWYEKGKTACVICTLEGSGLSGMPRDVKRMCAGATVDGNGLLAISLGDWCAPANPRKVPLILTDSIEAFDFSNKAAMMFNASATKKTPRFVGVLQTE